MTGSDLVRFISKVDMANGCCVWVGATDSGGYGKFYLDKKYLGAHRVAFEYFVGPIVSGMDIDHLCRMRLCVRPDHLRMVTRRENLLANGSLSSAKVNSDKIKCPRGHCYNKKNTYYYKERRYCKLCSIDQQKKRRIECRKVH
jgi:hypothetical protein